MAESKASRIAIAALTLSATGFVGIAIDEGYSSKAYPDPVRGAALPTIGFGSTGPDVKMGDTTTPPQAMRRMLVDLQGRETRMRTCVKVPLTQYEYDAYLSHSYNIGMEAFCASTIVKRLNTGDYAGACQAIMQWTWSTGPDGQKINCAEPANARICGGLVERRRRTVAQCQGAAQ